MGTLGGALEARHVNARDGRLIAEVRGEVETEDKVLVLRRIHVKYRLVAPQAERPTIERAHDFHARSCPVYRSLEGSIAITTELELIDERSIES